MTPEQRPQTYEEALEHAHQARARLAAAVEGIRPGAAIRRGALPAVAIAAAAGFLVGLNPRMAQRVGMVLVRRWAGEIGNLPFLE